VAEELDLHLLELARAEGVVARVDLVAKSLTDLGNAERHLHPRRVHHVLEIGKNTLGGLGTEIGRAASVLHRANMRREHKVELPRIGQITTTDWTRPWDTVRDGRALPHRSQQPNIPV
jgi:hypothetical protein